MFYVYILRDNKTSRLYKGFSGNLKSRLTSHSSGSVKTTSQGKYELIFYCAFLDKNKALLFEKYLKHGSGAAFCKKHLI